MLVVQVLQPFFAATEVRAGRAEQTLQWPTRLGPGFPLADSDAVFHTAQVVILAEAIEWVVLVTMIVAP